MQTNKQDVLTVAKYLLYRGVDSPLRVQKLLFFLRYEEIQNEELEDSYFDDNFNFEAWIYGPVNRRSYNALQYYFNREDEKENFVLSDEEAAMVDRKYGQYFLKWNQFSSDQLIEIAQKNLGWIKARGVLYPDDLCSEKLDEEARTFTEFSE